jgi:hypothetical protein
VNFSFLGLIFRLGFISVQEVVLSLCGLPFITGFFSKDLILELIIISRVNILDTGVGSPQQINGTQLQWSML